MPELKTLDQQRAVFAWDKVEALRGGLKDYLPLVRNLPSMLQTNGLGQTLAFLMGEEGAKKKLYLHLQEWLCMTAPYPVYQSPPGKEAHLMRSLAHGSSLTLRHATLEVQALSIWLKRFAEAMGNAASAANPEVIAADEPQSTPVSVGGN